MLLKYKGSFYESPSLELDRDSITPRLMLYVTDLDRPIEGTYENTRILYGDYAPHDIEIEPQRFARTPEPQELYDEIMKENRTHNYVDMDQLIIDLAKPI